MPSSREARVGALARLQQAIGALRDSVRALRRTKFSLRPLSVEMALTTAPTVSLVWLHTAPIVRAGERAAQLCWRAQQVCINIT